MDREEELLRKRANAVALMMDVQRAALEAERKVGEIDAELQHLREKDEIRIRQGILKRVRK